MKRQAIAVLRASRLLDKYARLTDELIESLAINPRGETQWVAEKIIELIERKRAIAELAQASRALFAAITEEECWALKACVRGRSQQAADAAGVARASVLAVAKRGLDKCARTLRERELSFGAMSFLREKAHNRAK